MRKVLVLILLLAGSVQGAQPNQVSGRIVLYEWYLHEQTPNDTFVLELVNRSEIAKYGKFVLVIYRRYWVGDAPMVPNEDVMPRLAFLGRGPVWVFSLEPPDNEQNHYCADVQEVSHQYLEVEDEKGAAKVFRYVTTPGADASSIPPIATLKCLVLQPRGWSKAEPSSSK